jgi:hypothetical protein
VLVEDHQLALSLGQDGWQACPLSRCPCISILTFLPWSWHILSECWLYFALSPISLWVTESRTLVKQRLYPMVGCWHCALCQPLQPCDGGSLHCLALGGRCEPSYCQCPPWPSGVLMATATFPAGSHEVQSSVGWLMCCSCPLMQTVLPVPLMDSLPRTRVFFP